MAWSCTDVPFVTAFFFCWSSSNRKISNLRNTEEQPRWMEVIVVTVCRVSERGRWGELMQTRELNLLKAKQKHRCRIYWTAAGAGLYTIYSIYKKKNTSSGSIFHSSLTSDGWIVPACKSYCPGSLTSLAMRRLSRIIWHGGPTFPFSTSKQEFEKYLHCGHVLSVTKTWVAFNYVQRMPLEDCNI